MKGRAERWKSTARDVERTTPPDFIASPLHCVLRRAMPRLFGCRRSVHQLQCLRVSRGDEVLLEHFVKD